MFQADLGCEFRRNFGEQLRLQFAEVRKMSAHASRRVVLSKPIGGQNEWEACVVRSGVSIVRTLLAIRRRIRLLSVKWIFHQRLEWLVMRRERTIFETARHI